MDGYADYVVLAAAGAGVVWLIRVMLRGRRPARTDVSPVSEQWLAERRGKQE
jgi:hypothetical protein